MENATNTVDSDALLLHMVTDPRIVAQFIADDAAISAVESERARLFNILYPTNLIYSNRSQRIDTLSDRERRYLDARLDEGIDYFEAREEASRILRQISPRHPELIYVQDTTNGRTTNVLKKMVLEPEEIGIQEFGWLQDFFNAIESYLIS
jgi:hypothetical protein